MSQPVTSLSLSQKLDTSDDWIEVTHVNVMAGFVGFLKVECYKICAVTPKWLTGSKCGGNATRDRPPNDAADGPHSQGIGRMRNNRVNEITAWLEQCIFRVFWTCSSCRKKIPVWCVVTNNRCTWGELIARSLCGHAGHVCIRLMWCLMWQYKQSERREATVQY